MAVNSDNPAEPKKMFLSYLKDTLARRNARQRSQVCCCEILENANGGLPSNTKNVCSGRTESPADDESDMCECSGVAMSDERSKCKPSILKTLKKRFQLNASSGNDTHKIKCKSKQKIKPRESLNGSYPNTVREDALSEGFTSAVQRKGGPRLMCHLPSVHLLRSDDYLDDNSWLPSHGVTHDGVVHFSTRVPELVQSPYSCSSVSLPIVSLCACANEQSSNSKTPSETHANLRNLENHCPCSMRNDIESESRESSEGDYNEIFLEQIESTVYESCHPASRSSGLPSDRVKDTAVSSSPTPSIAKSKSLTCELVKLAKHGWYWGPISKEETEDKLMDQPDGAFIVRDSTADRYLLTLSFRSSGKTLHTRIEHLNGLFSFYSDPDQEGSASVVELIEHSMNYSQMGVFCYSRPRSPGYPSFPVRLTKPISRFTQVRSLQYLCRFVIRQYTRVDNIQKLPLPTRLKGYIQEGHY
ncbi:uncharacterized protein LOC124163915 [Ischnura elegans]|uniref:uncharacterized protein LOC124163915 n=1 Tax=Ischnura elegans TaxID=197161 RepID=UPI001ED8677B|nr:uncharacterized protein LOC124163915 [Ischnura elegans]